jgi:hypothetical protein
VIGELTVCRIFDKLNEILIREDNAVSVQSPVTICGDIHGQYEDLLELFRIANYDILNADHQRFIFMGDYVDRGKYSLNTILLLAIIKVRHPDRIFLLRGNHESRRVTRQYGFYSEILVHYGHAGLHQKCMEVFDLMPIMAVTDSDVVSMHGRLSPRLFFVGCIFCVCRSPRYLHPDSSMILRGAIPRRGRPVLGFPAVEAANTSSGANRRRDSVSSTGSDSSRDRIRSSKLDSNGTSLTRRAMRHRDRSSTFGRPRDIPGGVSTSRAS